MRTLFFLIVLTATNLFSQKIIDFKNFGRTGFYYVNEAGEGLEIIPAKYEDGHWEFKEGLGGVKMNDKWGFIDSSDKIVVPFIYDDVSPFNEGLSCVLLDGKWGVIDKTGKNIIPHSYDNLSDFEEGFAAFNSNGKCGFVNTQNKIITAIDYEYVNPFHEGLAGVKLDGKLGFIDYTGKLVIPFIYEYESGLSWNGEPFSYSFNEGAAFVKLKDKWGAIDKEGRPITKFIYDDYYGCDLEYINGLAELKKRGYSGIINLQGKKMVPFVYESLYWLFYGHNVSDNYYVARKKKGINKYGIIDENNNIIYPFELEDTYNYLGQGKLVKVKQELNGRTLYGLINLKGEVVAPIIYEDIYDYWDSDFAIFSKSSSIRDPEEFGIMDESGREITSKYYDDIYFFSEGLAAARLDGKYGYLDTNGKEVIGFKYDDAYSFDNGLAPVKIGGKWGYIDTTGKEIVAVIYDSIKHCEIKGYAIVLKDGFWGVIDQKGNTAIDFKFYQIDAYCNGTKWSGKSNSFIFERDQLIDTTSIVWYCSTGEQNYFLDKDFNSKLLKYKWYMTYIGDNLFMVYQDDKIGVIDHTGKEIIEPIYDEPEYGDYEYFSVYEYIDRGIPLNLGEERIWFDRNGVPLK
jgi:hypothetical protein